ncbi:MAG TPA: hypothetical protein VNM92_00175 [Thermoanaerobaculia bacterium]|nr:hypothetical protein [Thermoanaerobaculia bacterium]
MIATEALGVAKISLHLRTGQFNFAYVREYYERNRTNLGRSSRFLEQWNRPPPVANGQTIPLRLYFANEALKVNLELATLKPIHWLVPPLGKATGLILLITAQRPDQEPIAGVGMRLLQRIELPTHPEIVWVFAHTIDVARVAEAAAQSLAGFRRAAPHIILQPHHRLYGLMPDQVTGTRTFIETPVTA